MKDKEPIEKLFISYRRKDSGGWARPLAKHLKAIFGDKNVFFDIHDTAFGEDIVRTIKRHVKRADCVLVIVGPHWLQTMDEFGTPQINNPDDYVHLEVKEALESEIRTIPVLVGEGKLPPHDRLPDALKPLQKRLAIELREVYWEDDVARLVEELGGRSSWLTGWDGDVSNIIEKLKPLANLPLDWLTKPASPDSQQPRQVPARPTLPSRPPQPDKAIGRSFWDGEPPICPEMVVIPPGKFLMGSAELKGGAEKSEHPQHCVKIPAPFALGRYTVTVAQFEAFASSTDRLFAGGIFVPDHRHRDWQISAKASWKSPGFAQSKDHPVVGVSYDDACAYCDWLSERLGHEYRLP